MGKKIFALTLCLIIILCFTACTSTRNAPPDTADTIDSNYLKPVFEPDNITRISFYGNWGIGKEYKVPDEYMTEITEWLASYTVGEILHDANPIPPGTNTYYVEIEYSDGTVVKSGLNMISLNNTKYFVNRDAPPDCYYEILSQSD